MVVRAAWSNPDKTLRREEPSNRPGETPRSRHRWPIRLLEKSGPALCTSADFVLQNDWGIRVL